jgi:hypothetical protein
MDQDQDHRHPGTDPGQEIFFPDPEYCFNCKIFRWYVLLRQGIPRFLLQKMFYGLTGLNNISNVYILTFCSAGLFYFFSIFQEWSSPLT